MRRLLPSPSVELSDDEVRAAYGFPVGRPWLRGSMVSTLDGVMRGAGGTSRSIASEADKRVFSKLRAAAEVVLVGAGTVRDEDYHPSTTPIAIVSATLHLSMTLRLFAMRTSETARPLILTSASALSRAPSQLLAVADVAACGDDEVDLGIMLETMHQRGFQRIHCEGGPRLLGDLAAAELLDELLLTLTPTLHGGGATEHIMSVPGGLIPALRLTTTQVLEEDGSVFIRAQRATAGGS